jgi:hypothetical protein
MKKEAPMADVLSLSSSSLFFVAFRFFLFPSAVDCCVTAAVGRHARTQRRQAVRSTGDDKETDGKTGDATGDARLHPVLCVLSS